MPVDWIPPRSTKREYHEWDVDADKKMAYVGTKSATTGDDTPVLYEAETDTMYHADVDPDEKRLVPHETPSEELDPEETLGEYLEEIGKEMGWDSLSEFARDHLEDDEN